MMIRTTVDGRIDAAHIGPFAETMHGHTWKVRAWFRVDNDEDPTDIAILGGRLSDVLSLLDHETLDNVLGRRLSHSEGIATFVLRRLTEMNLKIEKVRVWRPGSGAEVSW